MSIPTSVPRPLTVRDVIVTPVSDHEWMVIDRRQARTALRGLLGFVVQRGGVYEAVRVGRPYVRHYCADLESVVREFVHPHTFLWELPHQVIEIREEDAVEVAPVAPVRSSRARASVRGAA